MLRGELVPILATSATENAGVAEFMEMVVSYLPSPVDGVKARLTKSGSDDEVSYEADSSAPLAALVFKTTADPFVGKLSLFRVFQGAIKSNSEVWDANQGQAERVGQLYLPKGKNQENLTEITAGDIGAVGKLSSTVTSDTLCTRDNQVTFDPIQMPVGYYRVAVSPASKADLDKMSIALSRIVEEDPSLQMTRNASTSETLITGLGDAQIDVAIDKIKRKFGAELRVKLPRVPYREDHYPHHPVRVPAQEAVRWPRPVRPCGPETGANGPRPGLPVWQRSGRWPCPQGIHPGRREGSRQGPGRGLSGWLSPR